MGRLMAGKINGMTLMYEHEKTQHGASNLVCITTQQPYHIEQGVEVRTKTWEVIWDSSSMRVKYRRIGNHTEWVTDPDVEISFEEALCKAQEYFTTRLKAHGSMDLSANGDITKYDAETNSWTVIEE